MIRVRVLPLLALLLCQGCGFYYKALSQEAVPPARITKAKIYRVRPLSLEKLAKPADYETEAQWREETRALAAEFHQEVMDESSNQGLAGRVKPAALDEAVAEGVLVQSEVVGIRREWSAFAGGFDFLEVEITLLQRPGDEVLFKGRVEVSSKRYGPVGWRAQAFPGRLALASWNLAVPIVSVIKTGKIAPVED